MVQIRLAVSEDKEGWNRVTSSSPHGTYAHTWEWADVIEQGLGIKALKLVAEDDGQIVGIYSGFLKEGKHKVLFSPIDVTWDFGGPCILTSAPDETMPELLFAMEKKCKENKAVSLRISPFFESDFSDLLTRSGYRRAERLTSVIDLTLSEEELFANLDKKTRNQVRQAEKNGLIVEESSEYLGEFYKCQADTAERTGMNLPPKILFERAMEFLGQKGMIKIHIVKQDDMIMGSSLCFYFKDYMVTRYWTAYSDHLNQRPYHALIWHLLKDGKANGIRICDLGGMPSDPENGVYRFKKGWSGRIVNADWYVKDIKLKMIRKICRKIRR